MDLDLELGLTEHTIEVLFGARAAGFALRQYFVTGRIHCLVWSDLPH